MGFWGFGASSWGPVGFSRTGKALGLAHDYQITYRRLDENDWYDHLAGKSWTDRGEVAEMLEQAMFLRELAATTEGHDDGADDTDLGT